MAVLDLPESVTAGPTARVLRRGSCPNPRPSATTRPPRCRRRGPRSRRRPIVRSAPCGFGQRRSALVAAPEIAKSEMRPQPALAAPAIGKFELASNPTVGVRYYNPLVGRYISRDPLGYRDGLNDYTYVHNNPINHIDPLGLEEAGGLPPVIIPPAGTAPSDNSAQDDATRTGTAKTQPEGAKLRTYYGPDAGGKGSNDRGNAGARQMMKLLDQITGGKREVAQEIRLKTKLVRQAKPDRSCGMKGPAV